MPGKSGIKICVICSFTETLPALFPFAYSWIPLPVCVHLLSIHFVANPLPGASFPDLYIGFLFL
jgi:hypothetical protein